MYKAIEFTCIFLRYVLYTNRNSVVIIKLYIKKHQYQILQQIFILFSESILFSTMEAIHEHHVSKTLHKTSFLTWCALGLCLFLLKYHWDRRRLYYFAWKVHGPIGWPIVGSALYFAGNCEGKLGFTLKLYACKNFLFKDILQNIMKFFREYKSPSRVWIGQKLIYGIAQPQDLQILLNSPHALKKDSLSRFAEPVGGQGLFTTSDGR